jgi:hypothetical protein
MAADRDSVDPPTGEEPQVILGQNNNSCPFLSQISTVINIDERGDRFVTVGTSECFIQEDGTHEHAEAKSLRVCSRALARSSPVMRAMFFGNFSEATQETIHLPEATQETIHLPEATQETIHLPEDDPVPMELLLHLSCGNLTPIDDFTYNHPAEVSVRPPFCIFLGE